MYCNDIIIGGPCQLCGFHHSGMSCEQHKAQMHAVSRKIVAAMKSAGKGEAMPKTDAQSLPADLQYIELNLNNYDMADVEQLNGWGIWARREINRLRHDISEAYDRRDAAETKFCTSLMEIERLRNIILKARHNGSVPEYPGNASNDYSTGAGTPMIWNGMKYVPENPPHKFMPSELAPRRCRKCGLSREVHNG